ncbi:hypothetical protein NUV89_07345 [Pseudomonas sp. 18.1.10]|uniref:hypothetical protein n=1 Tax=Pseudomonas sp. 18.1.10 TaxID=2969302 RepID=UPI0021502B0D|nr:hypothetical protein [Pseudomonas sp. 18.1.10]MCR4538204.1 hypothetical protein [Pseudomonas sp. 18.1.10]
MSKRSGVLFFFLAWCDVVLGGILPGVRPGSVVLYDEGRERIYEDIVGDKEGFGRSLISVNGASALHVSSRYDYFYTLVVQEGRVFVDCAYFDVRNSYNGAKASGGVCGLNTPLNNDYDEIAQVYSNEWRSSIFSFDTRAVVESGQGRDFLLGRIGEVEIFDRYVSADALKNALPQKIIRSRSGCFNFREAVGFLILLDKNESGFKYLDVLRSEEPMLLQRMQEQDLKDIAVERCP